MLNAQDWQNSKFPTPTNKALVKNLRLSSDQDPLFRNPQIPFSPSSVEQTNQVRQNRGEYFYYNLANAHCLAGSLELKDFANLKEFEISGQNITSLKAESISLVSFSSLKNNNLNIPWPLYIKALNLSIIPSLMKMS